MWREPIVGGAPPAIAGMSNMPTLIGRKVRAIVAKVLTRAARFRRPHRAAPPPTGVDHRSLRWHHADQVAVVAPNPSGCRLFDRAKQQGVAIMSADQLIGICR